MSERCHGRLPGPVRAWARGHGLRPTGSARSGPPSHRIRTQTAFRGLSMRIQWPNFEPKQAPTPLTCTDTRTPQERALRIRTVTPKNITDRADPVEFNRLSRTSPANPATTACPHAIPTGSPRSGPLSHRIRMPRAISSRSADLAEPTRVRSHATSPAPVDNSSGLHPICGMLRP